MKYSIELGEQSVQLMRSKFAGPWELLRHCLARQSAHLYLCAMYVWCL